MKNLINPTCLTVMLFSLSQQSFAGDIEVIQSSEPTEYCIPQTLIRGDYQNLIIDHNLVIPEEDHLKAADIFVAARLKSDPESFWLLKTFTWRKVENIFGLPEAQFLRYEQLPLAIPIHFFYDPFDATGLIGDVELLVGYGLIPDSPNPSTIDSFQEMMDSKRYELLWESMPAPSHPWMGYKPDYSVICFESQKLTREIITAGTDSEVIEEH